MDVLINLINGVIDPLIQLLRPFGITEAVFQFMLVGAILGLSIYLTLYTGMFSLANAGFMAIGAYVSVILTQRMGWSLGSGVLGGMVAAGLVAIPIGLPVLRLRDIYLAIATIGFGEIVRIVALNFDDTVSGILTSAQGEEVKFELLNGASGIKGIPKLTESWMLIIFLIVIVYLIMRLHRSRAGRAMAAVRQDEKAAASMGINVVYVKNSVFIMSAMLAGAAGAFNGHLTRIVVPGAFDFARAVDILAYAVLGGTSVVIGPLVGGLVLTALPEMLRKLPDLLSFIPQSFPEFADFLTNITKSRGLFTGLTLLLVIVFLPGGLVNPAGWQRFWQNWRGAAPDEALSKSKTPPQG